jgi:hypothetical protein
VTKTAAEIIDQITRVGGRIWVDGDKVRAHLPEALRPLVSVIQSHKPELMVELQRRPVMPHGVMIISWAPKAAPVRLSQCSVVTDTEKFIAVMLRELDNHLNGKKFLDGGWGLRDMLDRLAACGCVVALDDPEKALQ